MSFWETPRRRARIDVLIPSSFSRDSPHPRDRMIRLGLIARCLAAARVEALLIYHEDPEKPDKPNAKLIKLVMDYLNTAPYLRKRLFKLRPELRYAGILPPLNIPTHPEEPRMSEAHYREGLVIESGERSLVDAGLEKPLRVRRRLKKGSRIIVRIQPSNGRQKISIKSRRKAEIYPGFRTAILDEKLQEIVKAYDLRIATSRKGVDIREVWSGLGERLMKSSRACIAFGAAKEGLYEIAEKQGFSLDQEFDYVVNTFPAQGVRTIRTEEALAYTLAIINFLSA